MSEFYYHNLFETKGIEYLITIFFFLLLIPFWILLNRQEKVGQTIAALKGILSPAFLTVPKGLFYSRNHTWAFLQKNGNAKIGLDDLLVHLTGEVQVKLLKNTGDTLTKGEKFAELNRNGKLLQVVSPITGVITSNNTLIQSKSDHLMSDPYGQGWLVEIEPSNWQKETTNYYLADQAADWLKNEFARFKDFVVQSLSTQAMEQAQLVMQDGGELVDQTLKDMPAEVWNNFQKEFLQLNA